MLTCTPFVPRSWSHRHLGSRLAQVFAHSKTQLICPSSSGWWRASAWLSRNWCGSNMVAAMASCTDCQHRPTKIRGVLESSRHTSCGKPTFTSARARFHRHLSGGWRNSRCQKDSAMLLITRDVQKDQASILEHDGLFGSGRYHGTFSCGT